jgi:hypothetical protein
MDVLERASGPKYDLGADPAEPEWVATRKARFESERARMRSANLESETRRDSNACREFTLSGQARRCD